MFKDYADVLYISVSLRPVFDATGMQDPPPGNSQWLHSQPATPVQFSQYTSPSPLQAPAGKAYVSNSFNPDLKAAYVNQLVLSSSTPSQFWSCWTYKVRPSCMQL